jgi:hypothetical protein
MSSESTEKQVECRFAFYSKSNEQDDYTDIHLVKEAVYDPSTGLVKPNIKIIENYERSFYVTKKGLRDHTQKKEWTEYDNTDEFRSTQTNLQFAVAKAIGKPWVKGGLRELSASPFLYGTDILSTSMIKQEYRDKNKRVTPYSNAVFDTETDVLHGTGAIMMATISFKDKVFTAVQKKFVEGYADPVARIQVLAQRHLKEYISKRNITIEVVIVDKEIDIVKATIAKAHAWKPDFLSVWNLEFDMDKVIDACLKAGVDIATILSEPSLPNRYKNFKFKKGAAKKTTASGKVMNYKPSQRWHTVFCPASFYWIDAMSTYRQVRTGEPEEPSYGLDAILNKKLKIGKMTDIVPESEKYTGLEWHVFMQSKYPLEYVVYNMFDCISMEILDEETKDLQLSLPMFAGCTDFQHFNSQPKRASDRLHYFDLSGHIVMLPAHLRTDSGLKIIEENSEITTNIYCAVADLDIEGSYPNGECVFNISKETTSKELISIEGISDEMQRAQAINLSSGKSNAVEIATTLFKLPTFDKLLEEFEKEI